MKRCYVVLVVLLAIGVSAQAGLVPNGDFALYKPGTTERSTSVTTDIWVQLIGLNRDISGGTVTFADSSTRTTGEFVDIPGWLTGTDTSWGSLDKADLFSEGYDATDGSSAMNVFGSNWGGKGGLALSAATLDLGTAPVGDEVYELSAMMTGNPVRFLGLTVDGVLLTPTNSNGQGTGEGDWQKVVRTYASIPSGDVRILVGSSPGPGSRLKIDNVSFDTVPEPATIALLGFGGLALLRRKKR